MAVIADPGKGKGIICDIKAEELMIFLEVCAGAPEAALNLLYPKKELLLKILRGSGHARRCWKPGHEVFWCPVDKPIPTDDDYNARCALGWFACRLVEAGGRLEGRYACFRSGQKLKVSVGNPSLTKDATEPGLIILPYKCDTGQVMPGWFHVTYYSLRKEELKYCLKKSRTPEPKSRPKKRTQQRTQQRAR